MMKLMCLIVFLTICLLSMSDGYRILVVFPTPSRSHGILGNGYVRNLLEAGHEVTYITSHLIKNPSPRLRQVDVTSNYDLIPDGMLNFNEMLDQKMESSNEFIVMYFMYLTAKTTILHDNVQALLKDTTQDFDLVIAEWMFSELFAGFSSVYGCPLIWSSSLPPHGVLLKMIDETTNPAYTADAGSSIVPPFTFAQRANELWIQIKITFMRLSLVPFENSAHNEAFGPAAAMRGRTLPSFSEVKYNASFILGNSYPPLSPPTRLPANYKEIGGYHIEAHHTPLPHDLKMIMDNANHGVIYFSMGSNVKSKDMPEQLKSDLLKMFGELKQVVLWKFEEVLENLPKNVHVLPWAPQPSILAHPNCILFISHGGLLSLTETINFGVPIIGLPAFGDQFMNVEKAVLKGYAKRVNLNMNMAEPLKEAIQEIVADDGYRQKTKELSAIFNDRVVPPGVELVHWVEHVVRTRGADHLRSPALMVPWYQKAYLDLAAVVLFISYALYRLFKCLLCKKKNVSKAKKNK